MSVKSVEYKRERAKRVKVKLAQRYKKIKADRDQVRAIEYAQDMIFRLSNPTERLQKAPRRNASN